MTQPRDEDTIFTPIAKTLIETIDATSNVKNFVCKNVDQSIKFGAKTLVNVKENPKSQELMESFSNTAHKIPIVTIAVATLLPLISLPKSIIRPIPLSLLSLGLSVKYFYPEAVSDYAKISIAHYNRLRDRLSNNEEN